MCATAWSGLAHCAERSTSRSCSSPAAALNFWCSRSRRTSASRGSSSSPSTPAAVSGRGRSIFDLMCISVAAITRNSPATSRSSSCISAIASRYCCVMSAIGMSWMLTSFFLMRCSSRSSGPSNDSSLTGNASGADSKSVCPSMVLLVRDLHRVAPALHRVHRDGARALRPLEQDVLQAIGLREHGGPPRANRIEARVQRGGELHLDLDVADLAGAVPRLQILDLRLVRVERVVVDEHRIAL